MSLLTDRERKILEFAAQGLSDYKIARLLNIDPPSVARSRKNGLKKLEEAQETLAWAETLPKLPVKEMAK